MFFFTIDKCFSFVECVTVSVNPSSNFVPNCSTKTSRVFHLVSASSHGGWIDGHAHKAQCEGKAWTQSPLCHTLPLFFGCVGGSLALSVLPTDWTIKDVVIYSTKAHFQEFNVFT